jgi:hypothetical protein
MTCPARWELKGDKEHEHKGGFNEKKNAQYLGLAKLVSLDAMVGVYL